MAATPQLARRRMGASGRAGVPRCGSWVHRKTHRDHFGLTALEVLAGPRSARPSRPNPARGARWVLQAYVLLTARCSSCLLVARCLRVAKFSHPAARPCEVPPMLLDSALSPRSAHEPSNRPRPTLPLPRVRIPMSGTLAHRPCWTALPQFRFSHLQGTAPRSAPRIPVPNSPFLSPGTVA